MTLDEAKLRFARRCQTQAAYESSRAREILLGSRYMDADEEADVMFWQRLAAQSSAHARFWMGIEP